MQDSSKELLTGYKNRNRVADMENVVCILFPDKKEMEIRRDGEIIGFVFVDKDELNPIVKLVQGAFGIQAISLNDMEIIIDNWNQLVELSKKNDKVVDKNKESWEGNNIKRASNKANPNNKNVG